jgi:UDP:flavonoid glycosyltransferase YjiC (YdhE family)
MPYLHRQQHYCKKNSEHKKTLTPSILVESMQKVLHDNSYRKNAHQLKTTGERYGGANAVADWAEALMKAGIKWKQ